MYIFRMTHFTMPKQHKTSAKKRRQQNKKQYARRVSECSCDNASQISVPDCVTDETAVTIKKINDVKKIRESQGILKGN